MTYRGPEVIAYPNTLSGVSGFIDDLSLSIEETAKKELSEEVGAPIEKMSSIKIGSELVQVDETLGREWHVFPVLVEFDEAFTPTVNWENRSAVWQDLDQLGAMQLMPGFQPVVEAALALRDT